MKKILIHSYLLFSFFCVYSQNNYVDSLKTVLEKTEVDSVKCYVLLLLVDNADDDEWEQYNEQLFKLSKEKLKSLNLSESEQKVFTTYYAASLSNIGLQNYYKGDIPKSLDFYYKSLRLYSKINHYKGIATVYNLLGHSLFSKGEIENALNCYNKSLEISESIKDSSGISQAFNNLGLIYDSQGEVRKSLEYYNKALNIMKVIGTDVDIATAMNNIAAAHYLLGDINASIETYKNSLSIRREIGNKREISNTLGNIGYVYASIGNSKLAEHFYKESLKVIKETENKDQIAFSYNHLSSFYYSQGNYAKAIEYGNKCLSIAKEIGFVEIIKGSSSGLWKVYKAVGNHKLALENYELYIQMRDSLYNIETQKATIKQQTQYEYDKQKAIDDKAHEFEIKQKEEKAAADKNKQNIIIASVSLVLLLVGVFSGFLYNRFKITQKQKLVIEQKEKEANEQKEIIEEKHKEITDSINYAERIQRSFLASKELLDENLKDYFILFKPKDVVSGDFYWASKLNNGNFTFVTADSTGHGVPGAIMSLLNITSLEKAIETEISPERILNSTRKTIIERLKKDGSIDGGKDGMDCSLISFNKDKTKLEIAAANNPVWIMRTNTDTELVEVSDTQKKVTSTGSAAEIIEIKPDKMPVGKHDRDTELFTLHTVELQKGDIIYTLTDGFPDQFGGLKGKKFMSKKLRELLQSICQKPLKEQKEILERTFTEWVGDIEQIDDVTLVGVRV